MSLVQSAFVSSASSKYSAASLPLPLFASAPSSKEESPGKEFIDKASTLRREALEMEQKLREERGASATELNNDLPPPIYNNVKDSVWTYRIFFSEKPAPKDDKEDIEPSSRFGGKLTVFFKSDGYTEIISHKPSKDDKALKMVKAWGWDVENSNEDDKDYLLFSVDVQLPDGKKEKFYMQARQESESNSIFFQEGTVTVKQDVSKSGSRW
eukprot:CAMPEP_0198137024 /NCGR_PEP_ID=MMETSP1443-20131203/578_1 /TAXON_ID=186043 /ORGANISM="Entomoneis sp., Strain CCMP2396" /LENGTH=210 /DNA_ID=CAMNT_0043798345 /DNA_START=74 /DNA_END=704 /DNA_ORIENTATION=+